MTNFQQAGYETASRWQQLPSGTPVSFWPQYLLSLQSRLHQINVLARATGADAPQVGSKKAAAGIIRENTQLLTSIVDEVERMGSQLESLPSVLLSESALPRVIAVTVEYVKIGGDSRSVDDFGLWLKGISRKVELLHDEVWLLPQALGVAILERLTKETVALFVDTENEQNSARAENLRVMLAGLKYTHELEWTTTLENYIPFNALLRQDPAGIYPHMDFSSRDRYRRRIVHLSRRSDASELEVARIAVNLAAKHKQEHTVDARRSLRSAHVGYYLVGGGVAELCATINYHPTWDERLRTFLYRNPDDVYIGQIVVFSVLFMVLFTFELVPNHSAVNLLVIALALLILPATQGAVDLVNTIVTSLLPPEILPKMDFSAGLPAQFTTLVAIPTLLLSERQTRDLVHTIEVRYLGNQDPNLFFALVTDLPDSLSRPNEEHDARVQLAASLINSLNDRYQGVRGRFFLLHRHRIFNKRQGVWMGWERKRGKLLDLNKLLRGEYDSFPVKAGPTELLASVRFVITLDSDTRLPPGSACRLAGTLAHPLNAAIIDPELRIVTEGYAILQPRVGVSVQSATQSRLASFYSGEAGYDIYTRAVSDAYQDLYGEGSFTGKGIYEVETLHKVLDRRFPRNALLSHDLIEGAYARVGLVTDIEVIDDFPSHYSAYNRRKHRWVRGDWQILQWLLARVPDESGRLVTNPISTVSRWKILDNLRRSLVEPVTFLLLLAGWFVLPGGPVYWTLVTMCLLFLPAFVQLAFSLSRAIGKPTIKGLAVTLSGFGQSAFHAMLVLIFLPHQTLLSLDAIIRSLVRSFVTGAHLLEWETAAEAESNSTRPSVVDNYLKLSPLVAILIGLLLFMKSRQAFVVASPILVLWVAETGFVRWLNGSPGDLAFIPSREQNIFLRKLALRTWRFFLDYGTEKHRWLIPDNFEEGCAQQAARVSPTNLGFLLNSRQAALALGYLTLPETLRLTAATMQSLDQLQKYKGHIFNWYSTDTLLPLNPRVISSVDSGNLAASLYTLSAGLQTSADMPLVSNQLLFGLHDHLRILADLTPLPATWQALAQRLSSYTPENKDSVSPELLSLVMETELHAEPGDSSPSGKTEEVLYWEQQTALRIHEICSLISASAPWLLAEYKVLLNTAVVALDHQSLVPALGDIQPFINKLSMFVSQYSPGIDDQVNLAQLSLKLDSALQLALQLLQQIADTAEEAFRIAHQMDFAFLVDSQRGLLKIGYELAETPSAGVDGKLFDACYDLLASEARIATFLAIAKGDMEQDSWFKMGRTHVEAYGQASLISWTGTMFEYLMPTIWMRSYPETMMARSLDAAVHAHQRYAADTGGIPWGISECGHAGRDDMGNYGYHAFGVPQLALKWDATAGPVISPYSTCLALAAQPAQAIENMQRMAKMGWFGAYGFYEAADYTRNRVQPELVKEWMAHHQGMSLAALLNALQNNVFQDWFHANAHIEAAELILHEKPLSRDAVAAKQKVGGQGKTADAGETQPPNSELK